MEKLNICKKLLEAAALANLIEACESGYVSLDEESIILSNDALLDMLQEITAAQREVVRKGKGSNRSAIL